MIEGLLDMSSPLMFSDLKYPSVECSEVRLFSFLWEDAGEDIGARLVKLLSAR